MTLARARRGWQAPAPTEREAVLVLQISDAQVEFAGPVARSVAACEAGDPVDVAGLAIRADGDVVGWVVLKRGGAAPDRVARGAAVASGLRVDLRHQGRGIGAAALVAMGQSLGLGLDVIAEGVETSEYRQRLADFGCTSYQGHFFARPLPSADFDAYVATHAASSTHPATETEPAGATAFA